MEHAACSLFVGKMPIKSPAPLSRIWSIVSGALPKILWFAGCVQFIGLWPSNSVAAVWKCTPTSITFPVSGPKTVLGGPGDVFTFDTTTGIQTYNFPGIPAIKLPPSETEEKFEILSSQPYFLNAAQRACLESSVCVGRFLAISLPGQLLYKGQPVPRAAPEGSFLLIEGNQFSVTAGKCEQVTAPSR